MSFLPLMDELSSKKISKKISDKISDKNKALNKVAFYLARRDHSEKELYDKLKIRFEKQTALQAIDAAKEMGWLKTPCELAQQIYRILNDKKKGELYIQNYLKKLNLPSVVIDESLEYNKGLSLLNSKFDEWESYTFEQKQKPVRFLQSRGFSHVVIKKLLFKG